MLRQELRNIKDRLLALAPQNLGDAVVLCMTAFDLADGMSEDDDRQDDAGQLAVALRRLLRFLADESGVDLRDAAGEQFIVYDDDLAEFPELTDLPAKRNKAA